MFRMLRRSVGQNGDFDWDDFDPVAYYAHNYRTLRSDDRSILEHVRDHFARASDDGLLPPDARGIDVGTGPNLYPALTMLPFCGEVTLFEHSRRNIEWLEQEQGDGWPSWPVAWHQFWTVLCEQSAYEKFAEPRKALAERALVQEGSVYQLKPTARYDIGTMFFVAESITAQKSEFRSAMDHFLDALAPGAPFAIAFMEHSAGYDVGDRHFPATDIDSTTVSSCLRTRVSDISITHIGTGHDPLRAGYTGMLIALGRVNAGQHEEVKAPT
jgi:NNMT/PNMT/TEMT family